MLFLCVWLVACVVFLSVDCCIGPVCLRVFFATSCILKKLICHTVTVYSYVVSVIKLKVKIRIRDLPV